jgi:hypothetical protein
MYSTIILFALGVLGIFIHNLMKMDEENRKKDSDFNLPQYLMKERFSILLSLCVVIVSLIVKKEIAELEIAGSYIGLGFVAIGYMAQSIISAFRHRVKSVSDKIKGDE